MVSKRLRFFVGTMMLALVLAVALGTTGNVSNAKAFSASTSLTILSGDVSVRHGDGTFVAAVDGETLSAGDAIRTAAGARAILTYFEGSTVTIEPASEIRIDNAETLADGGTVVVMTQALGRTWHVVTKLITGSSKYEVKTPASTASVRGTEFQVDVDAIVTTVATTEGTVVAHVDDPAASAGAVDVPVKAGMTQTQRMGAPAASARAATEPERRATVTVGATNGLVVDAAGRTNGVTRSGKVVVQTPGAQVKRVGGKIVVTLPNVLDGALATFVAKKSADDDDDVQVDAKIEDSGTVQLLTDAAVSDGAKKTGGFELTRSNGTTEGRSLGDAEKEDLKSPRTGGASVGVLSGPHGTRRLVPATPESWTLAPTRRPTNDKSTTHRPAPTPKPSHTLRPLSTPERTPSPTETERD